MTADPFPDDDAWLMHALRHARYEVVPTKKAVDAVVAAVPRGVRVTVTASPSRGIASTLDFTERLTTLGYDVVPHLAARMISGPDELRDIVQRLTALKVRDVFCPAGDADPPAGSYHGALPLLRDLSEMGGPFADVGITGYPEPHPTIADEVARQSLLDKEGHATYIVSNMCFDPQAIGTWLRAVRARGVELPLLVGMPGPVERAKLLAIAGRIGVGQSIRYLSTHVATMARIAVPGGFSAEAFLHRAAPVLRDPALRVAGLHVFTFNQLAATERWRQDLLTQA